MKKLLLSLATVLLLASCGGGSELSKQLAEKEKEVNTAIEQHEKAVKDVEDALANLEGDLSNEEYLEKYMDAWHEVGQIEKTLKEAGKEMEEIIDEYIKAQIKKADDIKVPDSVTDKVQEEIFN